MPTDSDLIWIQDAVTEYNRARQWLDKQVAASVLTLLTIPGDKRYYLRRSELDRLLRPREVRPDGAGETGDSGASGSGDGQQSAG